MKSICLILAVARNGVIGRAGRLPWDLPADWAHFVETTRGGILIHGRRCQEHHGAPLPNREVIVLSRNPAYALPGAHVAHSLPAALALAEALPAPGPIWIGGGAAIYREALPLARRVHLTEIDADYAGDTFLLRSEITAAGFAQILESRPGPLGPVPFTFKVLAREM